MKEYATPFSMLHVVSLLSHKTRLEKFDNAIRAAVQEGDLVVDLGTGSGILALMAARAGASKVIAVDVNAESLTYAENAAKLNDLDDKIEFVHAHFSDYMPKAKADVVICEMLSSMMLIEQQVEASVHAIEHIMKPDGTLLPQDIRVFMSPIKSPIPEDRFSAAGFKFPMVPQTVTREQFDEVADFQEIAFFDLTQPATANAVDTIVRFKILSNARINGFVGIFQASLFEDIVLEMEDGWRELMLPLKEPIEVSRGEQITARVSFIPGRFDSLILEVLG
jgi:protein arginine N-methyltransferase 1